MTIGLIIAAIIAAVLAPLIVPLIRPLRATRSRAARERAIYRDQLTELEREVESGRISAEEAQSAGLEIRRKILAAAEAVDPAEASPAKPTSRFARTAAAGLVAVVIPFGSLAVYLWVGSPREPSHPFDPVRAQAEARERQTVTEMTPLVEQLAKRLQREPANLEGWALLARSYRALNRNAEAAQAYERAYSLSGRNVTYAGDYGEALILAGDGQVGSEANDLFEQVIRADASEPRARFYLALAKAQAGQPREAIAMWRSLEADSPADAAWLPAVRELIASTAADTGIDPASVPAASTAPIASTAGPTADDIAAAQSMSPAEQRAMIRNMVDGLAQRLAANPNDLEGWKRLGRSYLVLNETALGQQAYGRAVALAPTDLALLTDYADATLLAPGPVTVPRESAEMLRELLKTDGSNATALWLVGLADFEADNAKEAEALWTRLLAQLQPETPPYRTVQASLQALKKTP